MIKRFYILAVALCMVSGATLAQERLTLSDAIAIGMKHNYGLILSKLDSKAAEEMTGWGAAGALPTITGSSQFNVSQELLDSSSDVVALFSASVDGSVTLFNGFSISKTKMINDYKYQLSKGSEVVQIENMIYDITLAYNNYILTRGLLEINEVVYLLSKDRYQRDKATFELGGKNRYDLLQSESAYLDDYQNYLSQKRALQDALYTINLIMGVDISSRWSIDDEISVPNEEYLLGTLLDRVVTNNTTLKNQYLNQMVLEANIDIAKSDYMPKIDAIFGARYNLAGSSSSLQPYVGINLSTTIFAGGMVRRNHQIAKINAQIGEVNIEKMKQTIIASLMQQLDEYNYSKELYSISQRATEVAELNLKLSKEKFESGAIDSFDYRAVQLQYLQQSYNNLNIIFDIVKANTELCRLSGGMVSGTITH